jgi:large subunit ribosomal protein L17
MKKRVFGRKLSRSRPAREALFAGLARALILNGKIITTRAKAKAIQGEVEGFVSLAKKADLNSRRIVLSALDNARDAANALFQKVGPAFTSKKSGFTRIVPLPNRKGDNAKMVRIEWTEKTMEEAKEEKPRTKTQKTKVEAKSKKLVKGKSKTK